MSNPNPSPHTRFQSGHEKRGGKRKGQPNKATILSRTPAVVRPLAEVMADERCFKGPVSEVLESVARDYIHPLETRLSCANALLRAQTSTDPASPFERLSIAELQLLLEHIRSQRERQHARLIEGRTEDESAPATTNAGPRMIDAEVAAEPEPAAAKEPLD